MEVNVFLSGRDAPNEYLHMPNISSKTQNAALINLNPFVKQFKFDKHDF